MEPALSIGSGCSSVFSCRSGSRCLFLTEQYRVKQLAEEVSTTLTTFASQPLQYLRITSRVHLPEVGDDDSSEATSQDEDLVFYLPGLDTQRCVANYSVKSLTAYLNHLTERAEAAGHRFFDAANSVSQEPQSSVDPSAPLPAVARLFGVGVAPAAARLRLQEGVASAWGLAVDVVDDSVDIVAALDALSDANEMLLTIVGLQTVWLDCSKRLTTLLDCTSTAPFDGVLWGAVGEHVGGEGKRTCVGRWLIFCELASVLMKSVVTVGTHLAALSSVPTHLMDAAISASESTVQCFSLAEATATLVSAVEIVNITPLEVLGGGSYPEGAGSSLIVRTAMSLSRAVDGVSAPRRDGLWAHIFACDAVPGMEGVTPSLSNYNRHRGSVVESACTCGGASSVSLACFGATLDACCDRMRALCDEADEGGGVWAGMECVGAAVAQLRSAAASCRVWDELSHDLADTNAHTPEARAWALDVGVRMILETYKASQEKSSSGSAPQGSHPVGTVGAEPPRESLLADQTAHQTAISPAADPCVGFTQSGAVVQSALPFLLQSSAAVVQLRLCLQQARTEPSEGFMEQLAKLKRGV